MPYRSIDIEFADRQQLFDLVRPIEVYVQLLKSVEARRISGSNFNKYYHPRDIPHPRIDFRVNIDDLALESSILAKAESLRDAGQISGSSQRFTDWLEPDVVVRAHETATACGLKFKDELQKRNLLTLYQNRNLLVEFTARFLRELFSQAGGKFYVAWTYLRSPDPSYLSAMTQPCAQVLSNMASANHLNPDFLERFTHCFLNNVADQSVEESIISLAVRSSVWADLANSWSIG